MNAITTHQPAILGGSAFNTPSALLIRESQVDLLSETWDSSSVCRALASSNSFLEPLISFHITMQGTFITRDGWTAEVTRPCSFVLHYSMLLYTVLKRVEIKRPWSEWPALSWLYTYQWKPTVPEHMLSEHAIVARIYSTRTPHSLFLAMR